MEEIKTAENNNKNSFGRTVFEWVELLALSVACVMIVLNCFARYSPVDGTSMNQTLQDKDILILSELFYTPEVGDIVVFANEDTTYEKPYVKRIIATEGQTVDIDFEKQTVYVDGKISKCEEYAYYNEEKTQFYYDNGIVEYPYVVPEGHVFVMGDNRGNSHDSRALGAIDTRDIIGRVVFRLLPFEAIGTVE